MFRAVQQWFCYLFTNHYYVPEVKETDKSYYAHVICKHCKKRDIRRVYLGEVVK